MLREGTNGIYLEQSPQSLPPTRWFESDINSAGEAHAYDRLTVPIRRVRKTE